MKVASHADVLSLTNCVQELSRGINTTNELLRGSNVDRFRHPNAPGAGEEGDDGHDGDDEGLMRPRRTTNVRLRGLPQRRGARKNNFAVSIQCCKKRTFLFVYNVLLKREVRLHTNVLLSKHFPPSQLPEDMKDFHLSYIDFMLVQPSDNTIRDWNPSLGRACTVDDFRPDFYSSPKSSWNKSVTEVFVESFLDADTFSSHDVAAVRRAFGTRLKSLRRSMNVARMSHSDHLDLQAKARRDERKRTVSYGSI